MNPVEIIAAPYTVWVGPVGTAFPLVSAVPGAPWFKLGTSGSENYDEDGVTLALSQTIADWRSAGGTIARKAWRTEEVQEIRVPLVDMTPEQFAKVMDDAAVTTVAASTGVPGHRTFALDRGLTVKTFALLARGISSINEALASQLEAKVVMQAGDFEIPGKKGEPAKLDTVWRTLAPTTPPALRIREQSTAPA